MKRPTALLPNMNSINKPAVDRFNCKSRQREIMSNPPQRSTQIKGQRTFGFFFIFFFSPPPTVFFVSLCFVLFVFLLLSISRYQSVRPSVHWFNNIGNKKPKTEAIARLFIHQVEARPLRFECGSGYFLQIPYSES